MLDTTSSAAASAATPITEKDRKKGDNDSSNIGITSTKNIVLHPFDGQSPRTASTLWFNASDTTLFMFLESLCLVLCCAHVLLAMGILRYAGGWPWKGVEPLQWPNALQWMYMLEIVMATISMGLRQSRRQVLLRTGLCIPITLALSLCTDAVILFGCGGGGGGNTAYTHYGHLIITLARLIYTPFVLVRCIFLYPRWSQQTDCSRQHDD
jgi:hypothetical protein